MCQRKKLAQPVLTFTHAGDCDPLNVVLSLGHMLPIQASYIDHVGMAAILATVTKNKLNHLKGNQTEMDYVSGGFKSVH